MARIVASKLFADVNAARILLRVAYLAAWGSGTNSEKYCSADGALIPECLFETVHQPDAAQYKKYKKNKNARVCFHSFGVVLIKSGISY
jgi:hypothetical protein